MATCRLKHQPQTLLRHYTAIALDPKVSGGRFGCQPDKISRSRRRSATSSGCRRCFSRKESPTTEIDSIVHLLLDGTHPPLLLVRTVVRLGSEHLLDRVVYNVMIPLWRFTTSRALTYCEFVSVGSVVIRSNRLPLSGSCPPSSIGHCLWATPEAGSRSRSSSAAVLTVVIRCHAAPVQSCKYRWLRARDLNQGSERRWCAERRPPWHSASAS